MGQGTNAIEVTPDTLAEHERSDKSETLLTTIKAQIAENVARIESSKKMLRQGKLNSRQTD